MINSFWNICSTCPMPKEEKLNSEYKRNYVWHPIYKSVPQDVVSIPPQAFAKEVGFQRKKQYPDLAYRTNEVIGTDSGSQSKDAVDIRTRSEERGFGAASKSGPRSRSAEPGVGRQPAKTVMIQSYPPLSHGRGAPMPKMEEVPNDAEGVQKNTEYRSQFDWPRHSAGRICTARKSMSMGLIKAPDQPDCQVLTRSRCDPLGVYQKLPTHEEGGTSREINAQDLKKKAKTEYKAKYKPFTSYVYIEGQWKKTSRLVKIPEHHGSKHDIYPWYSEVMERLQRANEYKCRGHGHPIYGDSVSNVHNKRHDVTPVSRPMKEVPEVHIPSVTPENKPTETRKKEKREKSEKKTQSTEKRPEKEKKKEPRRPKSADPVKERKPRSQQRPQTAPPPVKERSSNPAPAHHAYAKKTAVKGETRMKSSSRAPSSKKQKEDSSRTGLPSDGRASRTSHHPPASSAGKVWLQAGAPVPEASPEKESFKGRHSDAVRPSTLLPAPQPPPPPVVEDNNTTAIEKPEAKAYEDIVHKTTSSTVPLTHVQTPEEVTGVKSPEPENWTVPLDKGQKLQWTDSSTNEPSLSQAKTIPPKTEAGEEEPAPEAVSTETGTSAPEDPTTQKTPIATVKMTTADVLDRARSRLDQFWGKNK